jgi:hypothetical protein
MAPKYSCFNDTSIILTIGQAEWDSPAKIVMIGAIIVPKF